MFKKYMHVERLGNIEVEGIDRGEVFVFPKLDGTNASVYIKNGELRAGSRNRELTLDKDNAGFYKYVLDNRGMFFEFFNKHPNHILYGEFLVKHSIKNYTDDAWRKFYIFDVYDTIEGNYIPYPIYKDWVLDMECLHPIKLMQDPDYESLIETAENNTYLMKEGFKGEGVVLKNYKYKNRYGRVTWAKIVRNEFKQTVRKKDPTKEIPMIEQDFIDQYLSRELIDKEFSKIVIEEEGWSSKFIPQLFGRVYHSIVEDYIWTFIKKNKQPTINFKRLNSLIVLKIKEERKDLF